ncbi:hypothetical protein C8J57DRAFT_1081375, partial [Mycena rebaudengoi]
LTKLKAFNRRFDIPTARKFKAVEEATSAIADIIAFDVHQSQGPDTVKKIVSLSHSASVHFHCSNGFALKSQYLCGAFVRSTMKGLVGQCPSDMRMPGRGKGAKQRSALNAIGIFQEIHTHGHEKLGAKALQMGSGIGIDTYGMQDHVGKALWRVVVPNSRLSDTIGHVFLDMVSKYGAISVQVTFDGGNGLGWLAAFQTTLRSSCRCDSTSNIPIESTWSYDRKFNGRSMQDILEEGRIHLIPGDVVHRNLFQWLWSKIVQIGLDEFVDYFNNKKTRKQRSRILPSGVAPNVVFDMHSDYGLENLAIPVAQEAIDELWALILTSHKKAYHWVSDEFDALASEVYI